MTTTVTKMKQQILHNKVKKMKMTVRMTMTARITTTVVMTMTTTMMMMTTTTMTTAVAALVVLSMKATIIIAAKKCKEIEYITCPRVDMNFIFTWSTRDIQLNTRK